MVKPEFLARVLAILACTVIFALASLPGAFCQETVAEETASHNQRGLEYFSKGYYEHSPKNQRAEVEKNYGLAVNAFKAAIAKDPSHPAAHRNLARVYFLQKNFDGAVKEYQTVVALDPDDLDAYVNLALACLELKKLDAAIQALEDAKGQTSDPKALETLDSYLAKVRAYQAETVR